MLHLSAYYTQIITVLICSQLSERHCLFCTICYLLEKINFLSGSSKRNLKFKGNNLKKLFLIIPHGTVFSFTSNVFLEMKEVGLYSSLLRKKAIQSHIFLPKHMVLTFSVKRLSVILT